MKKIHEILKGNHTKTISIVLKSKFRYRGEILDSNEEHVEIHDFMSKSNVVILISEIAEFKFNEIKSGGYLAK